MRVQGQWAYKSTYLAAAQDIPEFTQHGYSQVDASITLTGGHNTRYSISAFVQNAFNQNYLVYGTVAAPLFEILFDNPGRRWGITAAVHF
jgi:outer membrane receptor protein involved in Fe transport